MPDVTSLYKLQMALRKYPRLRSPLKKTYDFFKITIPLKFVEILRIFAPAGNFRFDSA